MNALDEQTSEGVEDRLALAQIDYGQNCLEAVC